MSKSNMLLGLAKGKVGDLVFYRDGGEQRTRTRVVPKNPRTPAQMAQRVKMANVSALYRLLSSVLSESFSNRPSNQSGYNAFAATAIPYAPYQTREMATADAVLPQPAFASRGTLPTIPLAGSFTEESPIGLEVGVESASSSVTISALSADLIAENPALRYGDKLTFVSLRFNDVADPTISAIQYEVVPNIVTFELSDSDSSTLASKDLNVSGGVLLSEDFLSISEGGRGMVALIHSRVDENGKLQTSTQQFLLSPSALSAYERYHSAESLNDAVQSYMVGAESTLR